METMAGVTVEVVDVIVVLLIAQITVTHVAMIIPVTHHKTERTATAMARVAMMMLVTLTVRRQRGRTRTALGRTVKQIRQESNRVTATATAVPSCEVNCASFHKYDVQTVVL